MAYIYELNTGHKLYLENQGTQTCLLVNITGPGQQQQASSSFQTGAWTVTPEAFLRGQGLLLKLTTAQGELYLNVQGTSMSVLAGGVSTEGERPIPMQQGAFPSSARMGQMSDMSPLEPIPLLEPMEPMQALKMGNMQMDPMSMRLGNMSMSMGGAAQSSEKTQEDEVKEATQKFCTQCGGAVESSDRFCSACGTAVRH